MALKHHLRRALSLPPHVVALRVYQLLIFRTKSFFLEIKDHFSATLATPNTNANLAFQPLFSTAPQIPNLSSVYPQLTRLLQHTLNHEFDLLGSGWMQVSHMSRADGVGGHRYEMAATNPPTVGQDHWIHHQVNRANQKAAKQIWSFIKAPYQPIDWHLDFKSGYRWNPLTWWFKVPYGHKAGVDIKVPWELSRMHHLAWLALGYGQEKKAEYLREFENQILDFIATNPPRYGVNWRCPMDVAIRSANWILAYEWFRLYGASHSEGFHDILKNSLIAHAHFIYNNLEKGKDGFRGNHYLADICGLAYISKFLPPSEETERWQHFTLTALDEEMNYQFFSEGSNFEGSTSYHRLSAEMMFYTSLIFCKDHRSHFSSAYYEKLHRFAAFSKSITRPDGDIVQIGDCDSGRFFKIQPLFRNSPDLEENHLSHRCLTEALDAFFDRLTHATTVEGHWIYAMARPPVKIEPRREVFNTSNLQKSSQEDQIVRQLLQLVKDLKPEDQSLFSQEATKVLPTDFIIRTLPFDLSSADFLPYPEFGVFIWKDPRSFLSFRCGPIGQKGRGGHDHNDQLAIEFYQDDSVKIADPGTGLYTPLPEIRNRYRSIKAHDTPHVLSENGEILETGALNQGLFSLRSQQEGRILHSSPGVLIGLCAKRKVLRMIASQGVSTLILDVSLTERKLARTSHSSLNLSKGYGLPRF